MPIVRLRKRLLDHLVKGATSAGELGLAFLMTAGVIHCGGRSEIDSADGATDSSADHGLAVEGAQEGGPGPTIEAAVYPDAQVVVEAAIVPDAGSDASISPLPEAPPPVVEAAVFPDAGSDAGPHPWVEAPK